MVILFDKFGVGIEIFGGIGYNRLSCSSKRVSASAGELVEGHAGVKELHGSRGEENECAEKVRLVGVFGYFGMGRSVMVGRDKVARGWDGGLCYDSGGD